MPLGYIYISGKETVNDLSNSSGSVNLRSTRALSYHSFALSVKKLVLLSKTLESASLQLHGWLKIIVTRLSDNS